MIIITKNSQVAGKKPISTDLVVGELCVNTKDKKLYSKHNDDTIIELGVPPIPDAPTILSPIGIKSSVQPTIITSDYSIENVDVHMMSEYQVATDTNFTDIVYDSGAVPDLLSHKIGIILNKNATYYIRARHAATIGGYSEQSTYVQITTANATVSTPTLTLTGYPKVPADATFNGTAFSSTGDPDIHSSTDYQVLDGETVVWESLDSTSLLTTTIPKGMIEQLHEYTFRIRYRDSYDICSEQSSITVTTIEKPQFIAMNIQTAPYMTIWSQDVDTLTREPNLPDTLPAQTTGHEFSLDGIYFAIGFGGSYEGSYIQLYKRNRFTFTRIASPVNNTPSAPRGFSQSPDGIYLAVAHATSPYVTVYKREGDTFSKLTLPSNPYGSGYSTSQSPDGIYLAVGGATSSYLSIYKRNGDTFTRLSISGTATGTINRVQFSPDGNYLATAGYTSPFINIYKRSGDTFTKLSNPSVLPANTGYIINQSPDSQHLAIGLGSSAYFYIYKRVGDVFTRFTTGAPSTTNWCSAINQSYSDDQAEYLYLTSAASPYFYKYIRNGDTYTLVATDSGIPADISQKRLSNIPRVL